MFREIQLWQMECEREEEKKRSEHWTKKEKEIFLSFSPHIYINSFVNKLHFFQGMNS